MKTKLALVVLAALGRAWCAPHGHGLPVRFEPNRGQAPASASFVARGPGYALWLNASGAELRSGNEVVRLLLVGSGSNAAGTGEEPLAARSNYFRGSKREWKTGIENFARVRYASVYSGIDIVYYGAGAALEYDFVLKPGASAAAIRLRFEGARPRRVDANGELVLASRGGESRQPAPVVYQKRNGVRVPIHGRYAIHRDGTVGFETGAYDKSQPLTIDPVLQFSTFWGGQLRESATAIALDRDGNVYTAGTSTSNDYPFSPNGFQKGNRGNTDIFVVKLDPTGTQVLYSTLLGGNDEETGPGFAVDPAGNAYIAGTTRSSNFPTTRGAYRETPYSDTDGFLAKLSPDGSTLVYSTYFGGRGADSLNGVAIDDAGAAYVTGDTRSPDFPVTTGAFQVDRKGPIDAFAAKFAPSGAGLQYSTLLGGDADSLIVSFESGRAIGVDRSGGAYIAGLTTMRDFPIARAFQDIHQGTADVFVTHLSPDGKALDFSTFLGGEGLDTPTAVAVDSSFNVYVAGYTEGIRFPTTANSAQGGNNNDGRTNTEGFLAKFAAGGQIQFSTMFGGRNDDRINALSVDAEGNVHMIGTTGSPDLPVSLDSFQRGIGSAVEAEPFDAFIGTLDKSGGRFTYLTYFGGSRNDYGNAIARDAAGNLFVAGFTQSANFPITPGALKRNTGFGTNVAFIARIGEERPSPAKLVIVSGNNQVTDQNQRAAEPLVVEVRDAFNAPLSQVTVAFAATNATLNATTATTDFQGRARVTVTAGARPGNASVRASFGAVPPVDFTLLVRRVGPTPPEITKGGIVGAGGSVPSVREISVGGLARLAGQYLAPDNEALEASAGELVDGKLPVSLLGTCLTVNGIAARLTFVSDREIRFQTPETPAGLAVPVQVITNCGQSGELRSEIELVEVAPVSPEFFFWQNNADGRNPVQAANARTGVGIGPSGAAGLALSPAGPGDEISIYGTGFGPTSPYVGTGVFPQERASLVELPTILLDGRELPEENRLFAGLAGGQPGLYQIDFRVPREIRNGNLNLQLRFGLRQTPPGAFLRIAGGLDLNPKLQVSPVRADFGDVILGQSREVPLTLANTGTALLEIAAFVTAHPAISVTPSFGFALQPGESHSISVRATPTGPGRIDTRIAISSSDPLSPVLDVPVGFNGIPQPPTPNPVPFLSAILPDSVEAGGTGFNLIVNGANFSRTSAVEINGRPLPTFFNHPGQLICQVPSTDISQAGQIRVTVFTPAPGGGRTSALILNVSPVAVVNGPSLSVNQLDLRFCPLVTSYLSVLDGAGQPIRNLPPAACFEDGTPVECRTLQAAAETPMSVTIAYGLNGLDTDEERILLKNAVRDFVISLPEGDRIQLIHLDDARQQIEFTTRRDVILNRIEELRPVPATNQLLDAAWFALQTTAREAGRRQAVVLFTGANDAGGFLNDYNQLLGTVRSANVPFFTYAFGSGARSTPLLAILRQLARDSSGRFTIETDPRNYLSLFGTLSRTLQSQYLVEFRAGSQDSRPRTMRFSFSLPDGPVSGTRTYTPCLSVAIIQEEKPVSPAPR